MRAGDGKRFAVGGELEIANSVRSEAGQPMARRAIERLRL